MDPSNAGRLEAIWIKPRHRADMKPVSAATLVENRGISDNANQNGRRQVTIIARETWQRLMAQTGGAVDPAARRANLMVSGIALEESRGRVLRVGTCRIEIQGETKPCERMDEALPGLREAMRPDWGGGAFGVILDSGEIRVGDPVQWVE
jgi:MOSC domain-containing protein YiiM